MDIVELSKNDEVVYITQAAFARMKGVSRQAISDKVRRGKIILHESGRIPINKKDVINSENKFSWSPFFEPFDYKPHRGGVYNNYSQFYELLKKLEDIPEAVIDMKYEKDLTNKRNPLPKSKGKKL